MLTFLGEVGRITKLAYRDGLDLFRRMWRTLLVVGLLLVAGTIAGEVLATTTSTLIGRTLVPALSAIAATYFCAPFFVALVHSVADDRVAYTREFRGTDRALVYFAWSAVFAMAFSILGLLAAIASPVRPPDTPPVIADVLGSLILAIVGWIVTVRTVPLLPGVAIEGREMTLGRAVGATRGHFWFISGSFLLTILAPIIGMAILFGIVLGSGAIDAGATWVMSSVMTLAFVPLAVFVSVVGFALSVRLYQRFAVE